MCFYCWKCSPQNPYNRDDVYYRMTLCCISKNILSAIFWLFAIRFFFDLIFTIVFIIFEIPLFFFLTLVVALFLIISILGHRLKVLWIYYIFEAATILLLIIDFGSLSWLIYSIAAKNGWLYDYAQKHISKKSDDTLFTASDRKYTPTDLILLIFSIFLFISFLHDLTNLFMINRAIKYLKQFYSPQPKPQNRPQSLGNLNLERSGFRNQPINNDDAYAKRNSIPSITAPQMEPIQRISHIEIAPDPLPSFQRNTPIPLPTDTPSELVSINGGYVYSFTDTIPPGHSFNPPTLPPTTTTTMPYERPIQVPVQRSVSSYIENQHEVEIVEEEDNIIRGKNDTRNPFADSSKKDGKKTGEKHHPNEAPPIPPKILQSQTSESSSFLYENVVIHSNTPISPFVPIPFHPPPDDQYQRLNRESEISSRTSSSYEEQIRTETLNQYEINYQNLDNQQQGEQNVIPQNEINYSNIEQEPHKRPIPKQRINSMKKTCDQQQNQIPPESNTQNEDTISFASDESDESEDIVAFWSHRPSTRQRRLSNDLLNEDGFLSDTSEEKDAQVQAIPKAPVLKNCGLLAMLQLEQKNQESEMAENSKNAESRGVRSDSLIFALESIKVMEEEEEEEGTGKRSQPIKHDHSVYSNLEYSKKENQSNSRNHDHREYSNQSNLESDNQLDPIRHDYHGYRNPESSTTYEHLPIIEAAASHHEQSTTVIKRDSITIRPNELHHLSHHQITVSQTMTSQTETPIIPASSNFFNSWGKVSTDMKTTAPFNEKKETEVTVDSDSPMNFSGDSSSDESDIEKRFEIFKQKLQSHLKTTNLNKPNFKEVDSSKREEPEISSSSQNGYVSVFEREEEEAAAAAAPTERFNFQEIQWSSSALSNYQIPRTSPPPIPQQPPPRPPKTSANRPPINYD